MANDARTTQPQTLDELKAAAETAQKAWADAQAEATREAQAAAWDQIADHIEAITEAADNHDTTAIRATVASLSTFVKSAFGSPPRASGNGGTRTVHEGSLADLIPAYLADHPDSSPGTIGRDLGRSSGAVSAAITRDNTGLVAQGTVIETNAKPKRYSLA